MRAIILILAAAAIGLGVLASRQAATIKDQRVQLAAEADRGKEASLALQAKCAQQAKVVFEEFAATSRGAGYENHYSVKLGKCLVYLRSQGIAEGNMVVNGFVADAFENKYVATFNLYASANTYPQDIKPMSCSVTAPSGKVQKCQSEDEFIKLIDVYMKG